jgi:putative ABC transport system permease protein
MNVLALSWTLARRDWRAGELHLLAAALVVAVAAISSVGFFVDRTKAALNLQARQLLGGDLVVASDAPLPAEWIEQAAALDLRTVRTVTFPSMAIAGNRAGSGAGNGAANGVATSAADGVANGAPNRKDDAAAVAPAAQLVSLKAVEQGYPLRGGLRIAPGPGAPDAVAPGVPPRGAVWVDSQLLATLGLAPGDSVVLGDRSFRIEAVVTLEVDRGTSFVNFAPRAMISLEDLAETGLVQPASRVTWRTLYAGEFAAVAAYERWALERTGGGRRIESFESGRPEMRAALDRAQQFLALVSLLSALIAAVAIAVAARRFSQRHMDGAAVMRAMGVSHRRLLALLLLEMLWLGLVAGLAGAAVGWLAHLALVGLAAPMIGLPLPPPSTLPALQAVVAGLLLLLGFAAVPLARLADVPPLRVLRRELGAPPVSAWLAAATALVAFSALLLWFAGDRRLAAFSIAGFGAGAVAFVLVAWLAVRALAPLRHLTGGGTGNAALRVAMASWSRRQGATVAQTAALAVGLMALMLLTVTRGDLLESWQRATPPDAPNRFVINIQPDQRDAVMRALGRAGIANFELHPMVRGRLVAINERAVDTQSVEDGRTRRLLEREFNLSYMERMQPHNQVTAGRWIDADALEVSVEDGILRTLDLALGDRLTFDVAGEQVTVTAVGVRKVAWDSMNVNFFMVLTPRALGDRPQSWITSFHLPPSNTALAGELLAQFPNLTVFDTSVIVRQVQQVLEHVVRAVQFLFLFTLAAGVVVLYAALASSRDDRIREAGLMRALGASRRQLNRAQLLELAVTGALAGLMAATGAVAIGALLAEQVFRFDFDPRWSTIPIGMAVGASLSLVAGWFSLRSVVNTPPLSTLRNA